MAAASDKARFYLEQYVPELQEYERKHIFSSEEIRSIAAKRSNFEHILNARGSKPADYARYATYEMNVDSLRKKRCKRLDVKSTGFNGQKTVFFILDRGVKKFPGDMGLWMQYIHFCQQAKANRKLAKVLTSVLRLKAREWGLWVLAAKHYAEHQGDMATARAYLQRGLRFCKSERKLWAEYMKLEMVYLAKLAARKKILGVNEEATTEPTHPVSQEGKDEDADMLLLPSLTGEDLDSDVSKGIEEIDTAALARLAITPALNGAIPIAIFDAAVKQFAADEDFSLQLFDLVASFPQVPSAENILRNILSHMQASAPDSPETIMAEAKIFLFGTDPQTADFPSALGEFLGSVREGSARLQVRAQIALAQLAVLTLLPFLRLREELDEDVVMVLKTSLRRYLRPLAQAQQAEDAALTKVGLSSLEARLRREGREVDAEILEACR